MIAQSAFRCSCADLSIAVRGSAAGFGGLDALAVDVVVWVELEAGFRREGVVASTRLMMEPFVVR